MIVEAETDIDYLIPTLRQHLGDMDSTKYRYLDSWLRTALLTAVGSLYRWWESKYLVSADVYDVNLIASGVITDTVTRNTEYSYFEFEAPPTIQIKDERIIILMASVSIKSGQLENFSWDLGHWRDDELSYSNIEGGKAKNQSLARDLAELESYIKPPMKRSVKTRRISFPEE